MGKREIRLYPQGIPEFSNRIVKAALVKKCKP